MKQKVLETPKKKLNLFALISLLLFPVLVIILLIPWYRLFLLRDDVLSTLFIQVIAMGVAGVLMIGFGLVSILKGKKRQGEFLGTWIGILGMVLGLISFGLSAYVIIDYLSVVA